MRTFLFVLFTLLVCTPAFANEKALSAAQTVLKLGSAKSPADKKLDPLTKVWSTGFAKGSKESDEVTRKATETAAEENWEAVEGGIEKNDESQTEHVKGQLASEDFRSEVSVAQEKGKQELEKHNEKEEARRQFYHYQQKPSSSGGYDSLGR